MFGVQLVAASGANAIGIVSDESKSEYVFNLGAKGVINRSEFKCWGAMPKVGTPEYDAYMQERERKRLEPAVATDTTKPGSSSTSNASAMALDPVH